MNAEIQKALLQIEQGKKWLEEIQLRCPHKEYEIALYSWRIGAINPAKICLDCRAHLGSPETKEDVEKGEKLMKPLTTDSDVLSQANIDDLLREFNPSAKGK